MTTYFTAADGVSQVQTLGPADTGVGFRAKVYAGGTALLALLGLAVTVFGLSKGYQDGAEQIFQGILTIIGAGPPALAAAKASKQAKNGTFDPAPPNPVGDVVQGISQIQDQFADLTRTVAGGVGLVQDAANVLGTIATTNNSPLVDEFLNRG